VMFRGAIARSRWERTGQHYGSAESSFQHGVTT
jgi:hypothetical protein